MTRTTEPAPVSKPIACVKCGLGAGKGLPPLVRIDGQEKVYAHSRPCPEGALLKALLTKQTIEGIRVDHGIRKKAPPAGPKRPIRKGMRHHK